MNRSSGGERSIWERLTGKLQRPDPLPLPPRRVRPRPTTRRRKATKKLEFTDVGGTVMHYSSGSSCVLFGDPSPWPEERVVMRRDPITREFSKSRVLKDLKAQKTSYYDGSGQLIEG